MGRKKKADADAERRRKEILAAPPKSTVDWTPIVNARTSDPQKRAALLIELASLDELERSCRPQALAGIAAAVRLMLDASKQRARLLGLNAIDDEDDEKNPKQNEVDRLRWVPGVKKKPPEAKPPEGANGG